MRKTALVFACVVSALGWIWIAGEALSDPGGWTGVGLVALWTVPLAGLATFSWLRPGRAVTVLETLAAVVVATTVSFAVAPDSWRTFENGHGPVRAIAVFVLLLPLALLAWRRPLLGGWLLLLVGVVPVVTASAVAGSFGFASTVAVGIPVAVDGSLFLLSPAPRS